MASKVKKKRATEQFILFDPPHRKRRVFCFVGPTIYGPKTVHFFANCFSRVEKMVSPLFLPMILLFLMNNHARKANTRYTKYRAKIHYHGKYNLAVKSFSLWLNHLV